VTYRHKKTTTEHLTDKQMGQQAENSQIRDERDQTLEIRDERVSCTGEQDEIEEQRSETSQPEMGDKWEIEMGDVGDVRAQDCQL
jgi:hypothetical protein